MSRGAVEELLSKAEQDAELRSELDRSLSGEAPVQSFLAAAAKRGFEFTAQQFVEAVGAAQPAASGALSDAALDGVAGGLLARATPVSRLTTRAVRAIGGYSAGPSVQKVGALGGLVSEEEEDIQV